MRRVERVGLARRHKVERLNFGRAEAQEEKSIVLSVMYSGVDLVRPVDRKRASTWNDCLEKADNQSLAHGDELARLFCSGWVVGYRPTDQYTTMDPYNIAGRNVISEIDIERSVQPPFIGGSKAQLVVAKESEAHTFGVSASADIAEGRLQCA